MPKATIFTYKSYKFEPEKKKIIFKYEIEFEDGRSMEFIDKVVLPKDEASAKGKLLHCYNNAEFDNLLHSLHIILGISYYKLFVPPKVRLSNPLSRNQAEFFNTVYKKGLGEFCYRNKIDPKRIAKFPFTVKRGLTPFKGVRPQRDNSANKILLGIAGGKDSIVAGELLKQQGEDITGFVVDTHDNMRIPEKIAEIMGVKILKIKHELDEKIYKPMEDAYKGHIPFSAVVGFLGTLIAYLYGYSYVAVGNEHSANFGNITYKGEEVNPAPFGQNNLAISWFSKSKENISRKDGFQIFRKDKLPERCGVNHQWSKTSEFEGMMQEYVHKYISSNITYFSAVRPFYEIRVVEMFSKYKKYFPYFTSCNESFKKNSSLFQREDRRDFSMIIPRSINKTAFPSPTHRKIPPFDCRSGQVTHTKNLVWWQALSPPLQKGETRLWCGQCPKCAFVFTMLAAFLTKKELLAIFRKNLFEDKKLLPVFNELLGFGKVKPFDCVGTFEEMRAAFLMAGKKYRDTAMMKEFLSVIPSEVPVQSSAQGRSREPVPPAPSNSAGKRRIGGSLSREIPLWNEMLDLPAHQTKKFPPLPLEREVFRTQPAPNLPEKFKFLGIKKILILGYGKEGKKTEKYLKLKYPYIKIGIADKKNNDDYLKKQRGYDLIIKTPGIPKEKVFRSYTTATNIFFSEAEKMKRDGNNIVTIGITGSKGKSTTSSLIHAILKKAGKNAELIGNIGRPMLEALSKPIKKDTIFVLEMSSYQLDDIKFSPDIAVILNLFPDHMPYHHGIENYYSSKKNIMKFQDERGVFIYNSKYKLLKKWAKEAMGKTIAYNEVPGFQKTKKYLHSRAAVLPSVATDRRDCDGTRKEADGKIIKFNETSFERPGQGTLLTKGRTGSLDPVMRLNLIGNHNIENIKAAITVAKLFNISDNIIEKALKKFKPLPHRLEFVGEFKGIKFYNDSISTTPESAIAAIEALNASSIRDGACPVSTNKHPISTILLGGEDRGYDFKNLEKTIKRRQIKNIVLFPDTGKRIFKSKKDRVGLNVLETGSMREAIKFAYKNCPPNSICLLSPASPSHNLWENFEERGEEFRKLVRKYS